MNQNVSFNKRENSSEKALPTSWNNEDAQVITKSRASKAQKHFRLSFSFICLLKFRRKEIDKDLKLRCLKHQLLVLRLFPSFLQEKRFTFIAAKL